jgi:hypothetical protein
MADCFLLDRCGFFRKYEHTQDLACRGFTNAYCRGAKQVDCSRMKYRAQHGCPPEDDMLPSGQTMPKHLGGRG